MDTVLDIIRKRRSIRSHTDRPIEREKIELLIEAANYAPSAGNIYPWKIVVVQDSRLVRKIQSVSPGMLGRPAALIAFCSDRQKAQSKLGNRGRDIFCFMDVAHAAQNLCILATELGIGTCCIMSFNREAVGEFLEIPEKYSADYLVSLGYPDGELIALEKRSLEETVLSWRGE
jgi:nitroreductase